MVLFSTWPIVKIPVTFGGGMTMEYGGFAEDGSAMKQPCSSQAAYHLSSTVSGS